MPQAKNINELQDLDNKTMKLINPKNVKFQLSNKMIIDVEFPSQKSDT